MIKKKGLYLNFNSDNTKDYVAIARVYIAVLFNEFGIFFLGFLR